jgi:hypothetical protein
MRLIVTLAQVTGLLASVAEVDYGTMFVFVSCECVQPDVSHDQLYPVLTRGGLKASLYEWFELDEASFILNAREPAQDAHASVIDTPAGRDFKAHVDAMSSRGMSEDEITTELLKKYYKSLHSKADMIGMSRA